MDDLPRVDILEKQLARLLGWIHTVETRIALILPLSTAMLGALAVLAPKFSDWTVSQAIFASFALVFLVLCVVFAALASFPRTTGPKGSLIFFGGIASKELDQYESSILNLKSEEYLKDLIRQCHRNANIAERKYAWIQKSLACLFISSIPWFVAIYSLYQVKQ